MVPKLTSFLVATTLALSLNAQQDSSVESLFHELNTIQNDTLRLLVLANIADSYAETKPDSAFYYSEIQLNLARSLKCKLNEANALVQMGYALTNLSNYPRSLQTYLSALEIAEDSTLEEHVIEKIYPDLKNFTLRPVPAHILRLSMLTKVHHYIGILYSNTNNNNKELSQYLQALELTQQTGDGIELCLVYLGLGRAYLALKKPDSALVFAQKAYDKSVQMGFKRYLGSIFINFARDYLSIGNKAKAKEYFREALAASKDQDYYRGIVASELELAKMHIQEGSADSGFYYANAAHKLSLILKTPELLLRSYTALVSCYTLGNNKDSIVKYQALIVKMNDSLFNTKQTQLFQSIDFEALQRQQEMQAAQKAYHDKLQKYFLLGGMAIFLFGVIFLWRNNREREKTNAILKRQKTDLEIAMNDLKTTQAQLVQSEKMASLGELTAGIAHEIQNPINFVNNFSEINKELLAEMNAEIDEGNINEVKTISLNVTGNEEKINQHGKRIDAIVKSMMQHSRETSGQKEPTDLNALADEYLRLSYRGFRARDKSFNVSLHTDFDATLSKMNIIPQDISRMLLNLYNNAFYAVSQKKQTEGYEPTLSISTRKLNGKVEIRIKDNGPGMPQKVKEKIFQPFFTTKPTGQGTGLGLSLSYDIIKAHGGEINVYTVEGEHTEFIIQLPVSI